MAKPQVKSQAFRPAVNGAVSTDNVFDRLTEGLLMFDEAGQLIQANAAAMALPAGSTALSTEQERAAFSRHCEIRDLSGNIIPIDFWPASRVLRGEAFTDYRVEICDKRDGRSWVVSYSGVPVKDAGGKQCFSMLILKDIFCGKGCVTERRRESDLLREVLGSLYVFVSVLTPDGHIKEINAAALNALGVKKEDVAGRPFIELDCWGRSSEARDWLKGGIEKAARGKTVRREVTIGLAGNRPAVMDFVLAPLKDGTNGVTHLVASGVNVTEQKNFEARLKKYQQELENMVVEQTRELMASNRQLHKEIQERRETEQELLRYQQELRHLSAHLQKVREEEQRKLSREIHDELGQLLTAIKMDLSLVQRRYKIGGDLAEKLVSLEKAVGHTIRSTQEICRKLRPSLLDDLGLQAAMESHLQEFAKRYGWECRFDIRMEDQRLEEIKMNAVFRVFQESLTNIARHANASQVEGFVRVEEGCVQMEIRDNGVGIPPEALTNPSSYGLMGMRERLLVLSGTLDITGAKNAGTTVKMTLPL